MTSSSRNSCSDRNYLDCDLRRNRARSCPRDAFFAPSGFCDWMVAQGDYRVGGVSGCAVLTPPTVRSGALVSRSRSNRPGLHRAARPPIPNPARRHGQLCWSDHQEPMHPLPGVTRHRNRTPPPRTRRTHSLSRRLMLSEQPHPIPHIPRQLHPRNTRDQRIIRVIQRLRTPPEPLIDSLTIILEIAMIVASHRYPTRSGLPSSSRLAIRIVEESPTNKRHH